MFRILAIETLAVPEGKYTPQAGMTGERKMELAIRSSRHDSVVKVLEEPAWFWLVKGYEYNDGKIIRKGDILPDNFYSEKGPCISVSAIVGENGMGKSSLLELLFRMINNTSYALREGLEVQKKALHFVRDIYARAWMEDNGQIYSIEQNDNILKICYQNSDEAGYVFDYDKPQENALTAEEAKKKLRKLFYTIVVNYSQYAYNTGDYMMEWDAPRKDDDSEESRCWLSSLFHKNDAYQTPIVLNPFRENGNININRERDLTQTRLYNLVLNEASPLKRILRKKDVKSFIFDVDDDLTPEPKKRYYSKKVIWQLKQMQLLKPQGADYKTVQDIGRRITAAWGHALGYTIESKHKDEYWKEMDDVRTINYIVYKTLKISRTYAKYYKYHDCFGNAKEVKKYVAELQNDNSHITLKIRRCLAFLYFHHYGTGVVNNDKVVGNEMTMKELKTAIENCVQEDDKIFNRLLKERYTTYYYGDVIDRHVWLEEELMPAPSFKTDILLADEQGEMVRFSSLSSGEKQMIYSISTVIYQLWNINSAWMGDDILKNVQYRNVCLVFDEIELYAHPKYQLMLINLLIESIKSLAIFHVYNVNIILATHSPFVLSDIPASNILCLEDGKAIEPKQKISSFCANVYDILNNQFFMDRFVGDFANNKLDELIEAVNKKKKSAQEIERLKCEAERIGDSFVRKLLLNKLAEQND
jgi:predicted ATP-binding protein involved in virulence